MAIVTDVAGLDRCRADGTLAMVLHLEGAEAIDPGLAALEAWHAAGVRSLGLVWSRPSAFGHGVPFRFPASPDTGPGLTDAGRALVRRCAQLGIVVDVSHLNAAGFADVARIGAAPIVASHCGLPRAVPVDAQPHRRPAARDRRQRRHRRDRLLPRLPARRRRRRRRHAALHARRPRAPRRGGRRHRPRRPRLGLRRRARCPPRSATWPRLPRLLDALRDDGFGADEVAAHRVGQLAARAGGGLGAALGAPLVAQDPVPDDVDRDPALDVALRCVPSCVKPSRSASAIAPALFGVVLSSTAAPTLREQPVEHRRDGARPAGPRRGRRGRPEADLNPPVTLHHAVDDDDAAQASEPSAVTAARTRADVRRSSRERTAASSGSSLDADEDRRARRPRKAAANAGASSGSRTRRRTSPSARPAGGSLSAPSACGPTRAARGRTPPSRSAGAASGRSRRRRHRHRRRRRRRRRAPRARARRPRTTPRSPRR